jgi:ATP-dependent Zn protease
VSIVPRGIAGAPMSLPPRTETTAPREMMEKDRYHDGRRVAESLVMDDISTGVQRY